MTDMPPRFKSLKDGVAALESLLREIEYAREKPARLVAEVNRLDVRPSYYGANMTPEQKEVADRTKALMADIVRREAETECDARLREVSMKLEGIRVLLPDLAAATCIELGVIARDLVRP